MSVEMGAACERCGAVPGATMPESPGGDPYDADARLLHYEHKLRYEIDAADLQAARDAGERVLVIDARSRRVYEEEHIPGALNLPHREMTAATTGALDKGALVVTYCDGIGCNASTKGALNLARLGFRVKELIGGLDWWKRDGHRTEGTVAPRSTRSGAVWAAVR